MTATPPFDPRRFESAALHYRAGRIPYPPRLIRRIAELVGLRESHRVLDLGCGPGQLAIAFSFFAGEVVEWTQSRKCSQSHRMPRKASLLMCAFARVAHLISILHLAGFVWSQWGAAFTGWTARTRCASSMR